MSAITRKSGNCRGLKITIMRNIHIVRYEVLFAIYKFARMRNHERK